MKTLVRMMFLVALALFAGSCGTQRETAVPSAEHRTALEALQAGRFLVKLDAVYPSSASPGSILRTRNTANCTEAILP